MTPSEKDMAASASSPENAVVESRVFNAPREAVFRAWTQADLMSQWFAPEPLTVPRAEIDAQPGGRYSLTMRDPEGNEYTSVGIFREVMRPEKLVYSDSVAEMPTSWLDMVNEAAGRPAGTPIPDGIVTITFEDAGAGKTKLTFSEMWDSKEIRDGFVSMQMIEGLNGSFDNLEKLLAREIVGAY